ncbi:hypothetical protein [Acuticoccus sp. I52.16.1]|uniref:hypothetical protein n=1 Tax=Acuticoccus sp. I52.16.1 TaxID=2928472 RepID=UPI001FD185BB|nr:hypothetical protein [Acuticoccus sp. I52.16.1]UOM34061.1 hypothetical protein MRB58_19865 [Acuticoccus sp. I52.16.1]
MTAALAMIAALSLAGCGNSSVNDAVGGVTSLLNVGGGPEQKPEPTPASVPQNSAKCPGVYVLPDTEVVRREAAGGGDDALQWQASITKTARECAPSGTGMRVRVGVAGRIVRGPKGGGTRSISLPLRVAVREGNDTTYSKVHTVDVQFDGPSKDWAFVDENVTVSETRQTQIFVGFDTK